jgi:AraC family transcriptional regulator of adaptative response/methylated-DNA-[protein]-cysteine methyltransferase
MNPLPQLHAGLAETPFGICQIVWGTPGICSLLWPDAPISSPNPKFSPILNQAPHWQRDDASAARLAESVFTPNSGAQTPRIWAHGTAFQLQVWSALTAIPFGTTTTYSAIATAIGRPRAARAVGSAVAANPVAFLIPCHRVVPAHNPPGQFRWGSNRKSSILNWEAKLKPRLHQLGEKE